MNRVLLLPFLIACAFTSESALAQLQHTRSPELTVFAGYTIGGEVEAKDESETETKIRLDESPNIGVAVNWPSKFPTEFELYYNHQSTNFEKGGPDMELDTLQIGGTYMGSGKKAVPFMVATIGGMRVAPQNNSADYLLSFTIGGGYKFYPWQRIGFRLEARVLGSVVDSNNAWFCGVDGGGTCVLKTSGNLAWQVQANAGVVVRF